jgi:mannosyltransferase
MTVVKPDETVVMQRIGHGTSSHRDPWDEHRSARPAEAPETLASPGVVSWLLPAILMGVLGFIEVTRPALWTDELATFGMVKTSTHDFFQLMHSTDAINSPYYVFMIGWTHLFGMSDFALRLPSVLAMAGAAAVVGLIGARLANPRVGLVAGLVFGLIPETSRYAQEARSYAFVILAAALATYLLMAMQRRPSFWRFAGYAACIALLGLMNAIALLLLLAHGWVVVAHYQAILRQWIASAAAGVAPVLPLIWLGHGQKSQIGWIPPVNGQTVTNFPYLVFGATAIGLILFALTLFALPLRRPIATYTAWAVIPSAALLGLSTISPLYLPRYILFTLPAWALLAATALRRWPVVISAVALVAIAAFGFSAQLAIRQPDGHQQATRAMAQTIAANEHSGDAVVYGMNDSGGDWVGRAAIAHYVSTARQPLDILATQPGVQSGYVGVPECTDTAKCLGDVQRVWVVRQGDYDNPLNNLGANKQSALGSKFQVLQVWHYTGLTLALLQAKPAKA